VIDVRPARPEEVPEILDLLSHYEVATGYFEPWYLEDPEYRSENSWIVREHGNLVGHLRVFPRRLRLAGGADIPVAGIGNVITHPDHRGRGHAATLLQVSLAEAKRKGYAFSLLWTHVPQVYERHGFGPSAQLVLELDPSTSTSSDSLSRQGGQERYQLAPFGEQDLPDVSALYDVANQGRAATTVRTTAYWRGLLARTPPDTLWLLARTPRGSLAGHLRAIVGPGGDVIIEELSCLPQHGDAARFLLAAAAGSRSKRARLVAPPSYEALFRDQVLGKGRAAGLMGRPLHLGAFAEALGLLLSDQLAGAGLDAFRVRLLEADPAGSDILVSPDGAHLVPTDTSPPAASLDAGQLTSLLFGGEREKERDTSVDAPAKRPTTATAEWLFPADDPVLWPADAF
jgi:N-acetylglutamate synthase-like GNAT family acetyltransferase